MMTMSGFDAWLEAPYVRAAQQADDYERWCDQEGLDPDGDHWDAFEAACEPDDEPEDPEDEVPPCPHQGRPDDECPCQEVW